MSPFQKSALHPAGPNGASPQAIAGEAWSLPRSRLSGPVVAVAAYFLLYLSWQAFDWLPGEDAKVGDLFFLPIGLTAVIAAWLASRRCAQSPRLRWFWRLFALALTAQLAGDTAMASYDFSSGEIPFPSLADPPYLLFYVLAGLALIRVPVAPTTAPQRTRIGLDLTIAILGGAMAIWYLVLAPTINEGGSNALQLATSIAYPVGDVVILAALAIVALRWSPPVLRRPLALIATGLAMFIVADIAYGYALLHGGYSGGDPIDVLWIGALCLFAVAAMQQPRVRAGAAEAAIPTRAATESKVSWLPFGALAVGSITLLSAEWGDQVIPDRSLVMTAIVLAVLIALRQFLAQGELIRLQGELRAAHDELAKLASRDPLTGIANRRSIDASLEDELVRAERYGRPLSLLFVDIDHFKAINDQHGHACGDEALKEFSSVLRDCLRPADLPGRWGGEEFVVVMPETGAPEALQAAERIRATVEDHRFSFDGGAGLTCSIGASSYPADGEEADVLLALADHAVYEAKRAGRNRVVSTG